MTDNKFKGAYMNYKLIIIFFTGMLIGQLWPTTEVKSNVPTIKLQGIKRITKQESFSDTNGDYFSTAYETKSGKNVFIHVSIEGRNNLP